MLATPKDKRRLYLATSLCDGLEDNNIQQIVMLLMTKGADPNVLVPNYGITPFHLVVGNDSEAFAESVTKLFLQHSGDPNVKSVDGLTPVHVAAAWGRSKVLQLLLANGGDPLCIDDDGRSPFHYAFDGKYYQAIAALSEYCIGLTSEDDKPKYNIKLEKVLVCNGNLLAEYKALENTVYSKNIVSSSNISTESTETEQECEDNIKYTGNVKKETVQGKYPNKNCCLLNDPVTLKMDQATIAARNANIGNVPKHFKSSSSPRAFVPTKWIEHEENCVNTAVNNLCVPFSSNCVVDHKSSKHTRYKQSSSGHYVGTTVTPNTKKSGKYEHKSQHVGHNSVSNYRDTSFIDNRCAHNKFAHNESNLFSYNKTPTKQYFDSGQSSCYKKKKKLFKRVPVLPESTKRSQRYLGSRKCTVTNSFVNTEHKSLLTPKMETRNNCTQHHNIKLTAHSTPRRKIKYLHSSCKKTRHSNSIHTQKENSPKNCLSPSRRENKIENTYSDSSILNESFDANTRLDFYTSPDTEVCTKVRKGHLFKSKFAVNLNDGKYDEDDVCEDSTLFEKYAFDSTIHQKERDQAKDCMCKENAFNLNALELCDKCKGPKQNYETHIEHNEKSWPPCTSNKPCVLLHKEDLVKNTDDKFTKNEFFNKAQENDKDLHDVEEEKDSPINNLLFEDNSIVDYTHNNYAEKFDISQGQKWFSSAENNPYNLSRMRISGESSTTNQTYASVQEEYIYEDVEQGIVLLERRYCTPTCLSEVTKDDDYQSAISNESAIIRLSPTPLSKELLSMDNQTLRKKLMEMGDTPGPITATTKHVYLKRLITLESNSKNSTFEPEASCVKTEKDLVIVQPWLKFGEWLNNLPSYALLEKNTFKEFVNPNPSRRWREGTAKTCFNYLLLDSRLTQNLPNRSNLAECDTWAIFLSAIFYVGKGKRSRPYSHLYDAFNAWVLKDRNVSSRKIQHILDIWNDGHGVVCLHIFQNTIPVEAYTREAAIIEALGVNNLDNCKSGDYYGIAATWSAKKKQTFGRYLLYRAMQIFMYEGERQLFPEHL